jgi:hypothetical protein
MYLKIIKEYQKKKKKKKSNPEKLILCGIRTPHILKIQYVHFHGSNLNFFGGFWQKILNISASAQRILTQKPDLERLLNSTNYVIT